MNIANKILELRTKAKLSQGDLAEKIGVSRQSISKWETGASVPELDKIILMSDIFDVSIDFLVKDDIEFIKKEQEKTFAEPIVHEKISTQKIVGFILLGVGALGFLLSFFARTLLLISVPILLAGVLCIFIKKYAGLKICWTYASLMTLFSHYFIGGSFMYIVNPTTFRFMGKIQLLMVVLATITYALLFWRTIVKFKTIKTRILAFFCCLSYTLVFQTIMNISVYFSITANNLSQVASEYLFSKSLIIGNAINIFIIIATIVFTVAYRIKNNKC